MPEEAAKFLVVEVGGTTLRLAQFDPRTSRLESCRRNPCPDYLTAPDEARSAPEHLLELLRDLAGEVLGGQTPGVVVIAFPGPVDASGTVLATPTVFGPSVGRRFPLKSECQRLWPGTRVIVLNDVTAAGHRYASLGPEDFCVVAVGSGVGHKVFVAGRAQSGPTGRGGEIGHLRVDLSADAPRCDCGARGHVGALASGRGALATARRRALSDPAGFALSALSSAVGSADRIDNQMLAAAFVAGDDWTIDVIGDGTRYLGMAMAAIHLAVGVERFVLVGGFSRALGDQYRQLVAEAAAGSCWRIGQDWDRMVHLGFPDDDDGLVGAGLYAVSNIERPDRRTSSPDDPDVIG